MPSQMQLKRQWVQPEWMHEHYVHMQASGAHKGSARGRAEPASWESTIKLCSTQTSLAWMLHSLPGKTCPVDACNWKHMDLSRITHTASVQVERDPLFIAVKDLC
jgi:hypothetical protein